MLITSHILATLVIGKALSLSQPELYAAFAGGVGVDIDHLFVNRKWLQDIKDFVYAGKITYGINQHSWIQELVFGILCGIVLGLLLSYLFQIRWWILPFFLFIHVGMDAVMKNRHEPFAPFSKFSYVGWLRSGTLGEIFISCIGLLIFFYQARL
jgi:hypothetical protein